MNIFSEKQLKLVNCHGETLESYASDLRFVNCCMDPEGTYVKIDGVFETVDERRRLIKGEIKRLEEVLERCGIE